MYTLIGERFERLLVLSELPRHVLPSGRKCRKFKCRCDCGKIISVFSTSLRTGNTKSCGCYNVEVATKLKTIHGMSQNPLYQVRISMLHRCYNESCQAYKDYGGRGITICKEWRDDILGLHNFITWEKSLSSSKKWKQGRLIDRINNDGNYEPTNCQFVNCQKSMLNRRVTIKVTWKGENLSLTEIWRKFGNPKVKYQTMLTRYRRGWSVERAIS